MIDRLNEINIIEKDILKLFYYDKMSLKDIAIQYGLSHDAVRKRKIRAERKLRDNQDLRYWLISKIPADPYDYHYHLCCINTPLCVCHTCGEALFRKDMVGSGTKECKLCSYKRWMKSLSKHTNKHRNVKEYKMTWEFYSGEKIPKYWHIHHMDNDKTNNSRDNLVCVSPEMHYEIHSVLAERYNSSFDKRAAQLLKTHL